MTPVLQAKGVAFRYNGAPVLGDLSLEVEQGEFIAIVGPSGCGKTTFLKVVGGLLAATDGDVLFRGDSLEAAVQRSAFGFVFQQPTLLAWRTVYQNVALPLEVLRRTQRWREPSEVIEAVGLGGFSDYYPHQLSGGMQQRVALARSLVHGPEVLLMDEPFSAIDELAREGFQEEMQDLWLLTRATVLFVTHSLQEALFLADRVIVLSQRPAHVVETFVVPFARPRPASLRYTPEFVEALQALRARLRT